MSRIIIFVFHNVVALIYVLRVCRRSEEIRQYQTNDQVADYIIHQHSRRLQQYKAHFLVTVHMVLNNQILQEK